MRLKRGINFLETCAASLCILYTIYTMQLMYTVYNFELLKFGGAAYVYCIQSAGIKKKRRLRAPKISL